MFNVSGKKILKFSYSHLALSGVQVEYLRFVVLVQHELFIPICQQVYVYHHRPISSLKLDL